MRKNRKITIIPLVISLLLIILSSQAAFAFTVPSPTSEFYVADFAKVLSSDTEEHIILENQNLENRFGAQIVVVTVDFLDGANIEDYAYKLFNSWQIGDKNKNNGILLLLAIGEENYWCMQGSGLESKLTAGDIDDILWNYLEEDFAAGDYDNGVYNVFDELCSEVSMIYNNESSSSSAASDYGNHRSSSIILYIFAIFFIALVLVTLFAVFSSLRNRGGFSAPYYPTRSRRRGGHSTFGSGSGRVRSSSSRRSSFSGRSSSSRPSSRRSSGGGGRSRGGGAGRR